MPILLVDKGRLYSVTDGQRKLAVFSKKPNKPIILLRNVSEATKEDIHRVSEAVGSARTMTDPPPAIPPQLRRHVRIDLRPFGGPLIR